MTRRASFSVGFSLALLFALSASAQRRHDPLNTEEINQLRDAMIGEIEQLRQRIASERHRFRRSLHLDEPPIPRLDDIHVDIGARVVVVGEIEQRLAIDDADARGGDVVRQRNGTNDIALAELLDRERQSDERAGD